MIITILGKGGSGKSSISTQFILFLHSIKKEVLAIDADHNMDLSFNLTIDNEIENIKYFGSSLENLKKIVNLDHNQKYDDFFVSNNLFNFYFGKIDSDKFTHQFINKIKDSLFLMSAGPQNDQVLNGQTCSHILTTPLKIYLPLLQVSDHQAVVIDEKAGADGVTTGIITGTDVAMIVIEPTIHSLKTGKQIASLLDFYETPYLFIANKIKNDDDKNYIKENLNHKLVYYLDFNEKISKEPNILAHDWIKYLEKIYDTAKKINKNDRLNRTKNKFTRNKQYLSK